MRIGQPISSTAISLLYGGDVAANSLKENGVIGFGEASYSISSDNSFPQSNNEGVVYSITGRANSNSSDANGNAESIKNKLRNLRDLVDKTDKKGNGKELILLRHAQVGFNIHHGYDVKNDWLTQEEENVEKSLSDLVNNYAIRNKENALKSLTDYANIYRNFISSINSNME